VALDVTLPSVTLMAPSTLTGKVNTPDAPAGASEPEKKRVTDAKAGNVGEMGVLLQPAASASHRTPMQRTNENFMRSHHSAASRVTIRSMKHPPRTRILAAVGLCLGLATIVVAGQTPAFDSNQKSQAKQMLEDIKRAIQNTYYDPLYHGVDLNARFKTADKQLDGATSMAYAYAVIAQALLEFGDSHTFFLPPMRSSLTEYGWTFGMVGDACVVLAVKPGSDAEKQGLKAGDQVQRIENLTPSRSELWKIRYLYYTLSPRKTLKVVVQSPGGQPRELSLAATVTKKSGVMEVSIEDLGQMIDQDSREAFASNNKIARAGDVAIWRLAGFSFEPSAANRVIDDATKGATALVIDMRGNGGGAVKTLQEIAGRLFDHDVTIATVKGRKSSKPMAARSKKPVFAGKIVVIVDADSASAAELLARTIQLEARGTVIGDQSAGAVMQAEQFQNGLEGLEGVIVYGASITNADLIMKDGKSLERAGVVPDEKMLITSEDLAAGRDPVLARAVALAGGQLDPMAAGKLFPIEWKK
jgi:C-terminal processing protease CtpA/Prc